MKLSPTNRFQLFENRIENKRLAEFLVFLPNLLRISRWPEYVRVRNGRNSAVLEQIWTIPVILVKSAYWRCLDIHIIDLMDVGRYDFYESDSLWRNAFYGLLIFTGHIGYMDISEQNTQKLFNFGDEEIKWNSTEGQSLKESLILSRDAKKFAIARDLYHLSTGEPFVKGAGSAGVLASMYILASGVNKKQNFYARPVGLRIAWYALVSMFAYTLWVFGQDFPTCMYEKDADLAAIELGETYLKGGLEYYNKILQRNIALHTLMGTEGEKLFTAGGNEQVSIRTKHLPLVMRRDYIQMKIDEESKAIEINKDSKSKEI
ncbi:unnamed protein product, partial [Meganyctiphanes norvegica]